MSGLKYFTDEDGFAILETSGGYLQYFRGYRIQLSGTPEGFGDNGSSSAVIHHHFSNVNNSCVGDEATKFIHLVGLSHVGEALSGRTGSCHVAVIKQLKQEPKIFEDFMEHLLSNDFGQNTTYKFSLQDTLNQVRPIELDSLNSIVNCEYLEGVNEGSVSIAYGTIGNSAVVVDARTLKGYILDFEYFNNNRSLGANDLLFMKNTLLYLVTFIEEYPRLLPPHFYVNKKRADSIKLATS